MSIDLNALDTLTRRGEWGKLNHSVYRFVVPVHIVFCPKFRRKIFANNTVEVQDILKGVAEEEGLHVIAVAAEPDHIHILLVHAAPGGMPPTWQWSTWIGRFKALTSRRLKGLVGLEEFTWQTGYSICSVTGNTLEQSQEEAIEAVTGYIVNQGTQGHGIPQDPEDAPVLEDTLPWDSLPG